MHFFADTRYSLGQRSRKVGRLKKIMILKKAVKTIDSNRFFGYNKYSISYAKI